MTMKRLTLTVTEAAQMLGISRGTAYEAARTGELPTVRMGRRRLVPVSALEELLSGAGAAVGVESKG
jgi:excisionase family DNA binding protein